MLSPGTKLGQSVKPAKCVFVVQYGQDPVIGPGFARAGKQIKGLGSEVHADAMSVPGSGTEVAYFVSTPCSDAEMPFIVED